MQDLMLYTLSFDLPCIWQYFMIFMFSILEKCKNLAEKCKHLAEKCKNLAKKCKNLAQKCKNLAQK